LQVVVAATAAGARVIQSDASPRIASTFALHSGQGEYEMADERTLVGHAQISLNGLSTNP
jgi:hypothetical protein